MFEVAARVRSEVCGGRGGVGWGEARGGARSGSGGPRESKSHSSSSIHSAHSAAHHTHSHTRLCRSPAGSSQCGRPSWYIRTAKASRRSSRSSGAAPPFGIWHVAKGLGVGAVRRRGGHYGCRCGCGTCSRAARRSPNERIRAPSPNPLGPRPPPSTKRGAHGGLLRCREWTTCAPGCSRWRVGRQPPGVDACVCPRVLATSLFLHVCSLTGHASQETIV